MQQEETRLGAPMHSMRPTRFNARQSQPPQGMQMHEVIKPEEDFIQQTVAEGKHLFNSFRGNDAPWQ